ncbi:MAG: extracellular solute-binding protein [Rhodospirillales bacterium]|nr:extracellular solute-binding protein [Rhodospirillales bacterium]
MTDTKLRILGTSVTLFKEVQDLARQDLDFQIEFDVQGGVEVLQKGILRPDTYDIYDQWYHSIDLLWTAGAIQSIDANRLELWDEVGGLTKTGTVVDGASLGVGSRPMDVQFVQEDGSLGSSKSDLLSAVPTAHNADSFSYDPALKPKSLRDVPESWGWLLNEAWRGKIGMNTDPSIGIADMILAAQAMGLTKFKDIGNLTIEEIDELVESLIAYKKNSHFGGMWSTVTDSVEYMAGRKGRIGGIWSPAVSRLRARNVPVRVAAPVEGYRAWHSGLCLSSQLPTAKTKAAYQYLNWWLSGRPGAILARQGYYTSTPERTRSYLSEAEWGYWYAGEEAKEDLCDPQGRKTIKKGSEREDGSCQDRMSNIIMWNTLMDEQNYLVRRWNELLAA